MKKFITLLVLTFLFTGTSFAQTASDANVVGVTVNDYVELTVDSDISYNYDVLANVVTGPGSPSIVQQNPGITIVAEDATWLSWKTNLSNMKISVERDVFTGDFSFMGMRLGPHGQIDGVSGSIGSYGTPVGTVPVSTSATDFITGISQAGGTLDLVYELDLSVFNVGSSSTVVTYTIASE